MTIKLLCTLVLGLFLGAALDDWLTREMVQAGLYCQQAGRSTPIVNGLYGPITYDTGARPERSAR